MMTTGPPASGVRFCRLLVKRRLSGLANFAADLVRLCLPGKPPLDCLADIL
jgi:hypothetical protein